MCLNDTTKRFWVLPIGLTVNLLYAFPGFICFLDVVVHQKDLQLGIPRTHCLESSCLLTLSKNTQTPKKVLLPERIPLHINCGMLQQPPVGSNVFPPLKVKNLGNE